MKLIGSLRGELIVCGVRRRRDEHHDERREHPLPAKDPHSRATCEARLGFPRVTVTFRSVTTRGHHVWLAGALAVAGCANQRTYKAGDSMVPTIAAGERVAVDVAAVTRRGSVVVFRAPEAPAREFVKRVVGLPGDTISTNGMDLQVNGTLVPHCLVGAFQSVDANGAPRTGTLYMAPKPLDRALRVARLPLERRSRAAVGTVDRPCRRELFRCSATAAGGTATTRAFWYRGMGGTLLYCEASSVGTVTSVPGAPMLPAGCQRTRTRARSLPDDCWSTLQISTVPRAWR